MSVYHPHNVNCNCGFSFTHALVESANVERSPAIRKAVLEGTFHRIHCPKCGQRVTVETKFYFADPLRKSLYLVQPSNQRHESKSDSKEVLRSIKIFPKKVLDMRDAKIRVVYGLDELREKLVCEDAGLNDRLLETAKLYILRDHPFLMKHNRLVIYLTEVRDGMLNFIIGHRNRREIFSSSFPLAVLDELNPPTGTRTRGAKKSRNTAHKAALRKGLRGIGPAAPNLFDGLLGIFGGGGSAGSSSSSPTNSNFWVNFRSLSNRNEAKAALQAAADAIRAGKDVPLSGGEFNKMISLLAGNASSLDAASKQNLQVLFDYAVEKKSSKAQELLTEVRFGVPLDDEWSSNSAQKDIPVIWRVLSQLPASNVVGNVALKRIDVEGSGGGGVYEPGSGIITIYGGTASATSNSGVESYEDTLRHEVGHAVHWRRKAEIDAWLKSSFGWEEFASNTSGILAWAGKMGAAAWPAGTSAELQRAAAAVLAASLPGSGWNDGPIQDASASSAVRDVLSHKDCGIAKAWIQTGSNWYQRCDKWFSANGRSFFVNFWYRTFMCVNTSTIELVGKMPSLYAAMSPPEFFAELYALWYDADDNKRKVVPDFARDWFAANVG